jgi:PBP1b-binding outer membrane lipoprotein LpoB
MFRPFPVIARLSALGLVAALCACAPGTRSIDNPSGRPPVYVNPGETDQVSGVGFESQDLVAMTDEMMRDMLANEAIARAKVKPRVVIDDQYFRNESSERVNKSMITDRLRVNLNRAADGKIIFVGAQYLEMMQKERDLEGKPRPGGADLAQVDYRLGGRINTLDAVDQKTGARSRFFQITFEMFDIQSGEIVWSGMYDYKKSAQDDVIYR